MELRWPWLLAGFSVAVGVVAYFQYTSSVSALEYIGSGSLMNPLDSAKALIRKWEGLSLKEYRDVAGFRTIGYGHKLAAGESYPNGITAVQAENILDVDVGKVWQGIANYLPDGLTNNQQAALIDFAYNLGESALEGSTLLRKLNAGDVAGASAQFGVWVYAHVNGIATRIDGLVNRRADEQQLFNT